MKELKDIISKATIKNWERLNKKLNVASFTKRANKTMSEKRIIPTEYLDENDKELADEMLAKISEYDDLKETKIDSLILEYLIINNLISKDRKTFKNSYLKSFYNTLSLSAKGYDYSFSKKPSGDFLGYIYQVMQKEGTKNITGSYYTPKEIVKDLIDNVDFTNKKICDPSCGTGGFINEIIKYNNINPNNIYGYDIDLVAVKIAKANLFVLFKDYDFSPNIYNEDFLMSPDKIKYDIIITNPPWGAKNGDYLELFPMIKSKESFSYFLVKSIKRLNDKGIIKFLLPISILNVKAHKDIREYILNNTSITEIKTFGKPFSGVLSDVISLSLTKDDCDNFITIKNKRKKYLIINQRYKKSRDYVFTLYNENISRVIKKISSKNDNILSDATFALGIVTGDNKKHLKDNKIGYEPIYRGKDIGKYHLLKPKKYIKFNPLKFQQTASEKLYRSKEKLVYKFISSKLVFAYDNKGSLILNSANMIIPNKDKISAKSLCLILNSNVLNFYFKYQVGQFKILQNDLISLPIPKLSKEEEKKLNYIFDNIEKVKEESIQQEIYKIYNLNCSDIQIIESELSSGKIKRKIK